MERLKDFFYNKNDIIVALLIFLIAVIIIYFRVVDIANYPKTHVQNETDNKTVSEQQLEEQNNE